MTSIVQQSNLVHILDSYRMQHNSAAVYPSRRAQSFSVSSSAAALMNCLSNSDFGNLGVSNASSTNVKVSSVLSSSREHRRLDRSVSEPVTAGDCQNNNVVNSQQQQNQQPSHNPAVNSSRYKTELCRPFDENGSCKYGEKCQFAHGIHELRTLARHPKYKTELCRTFHTVGFCPYGPRCHFIHNEDERKLNNLVNANQQANNARNSASPPQQQQQQLQQLQQSRHITSVQQTRFPFGSLSSLGSSASDSNPSSLSSGSPPSLSPTFTGSEDLLASSGSSTCGHNSPPSRYSPVFNFNRDIVPASSLIAPLNVQTHEVSIENLVRTLEAIGVGDEEVAAYHPIHSPVDSGAFTGSRPSSSSYGPATPESISGESASSGSCRSPPLVPVGGKSGCSIGYRLPCFDQFRSVC